MTRSVAIWLSGACLMGVFLVLDVPVLVLIPLLPMVVGVVVPR